MLGRLILLLLLAAGPLRAQDFAPVPAPEGVEVDVELLLLVDASRSMTYHEIGIQRQGYAAALRSGPVLDAIAGGLTGRVAMSYAEWAGFGQVRVVVPWRMLEDGAGADAFAAEIEAAPRAVMSRTSIAFALQAALPAFAGNGFRGLRQVIDISGDGPNNQGGDVRVARDAVLAAGITINGLPLMTREGMGAEWHLEDLDLYYAECVIGGSGSFVIPVRDWADFAGAVQRKLVLELVGLEPERRLAPQPAQFAAEGRDCLIGEKIWQRTRRFWGMP